MPYYFEDLKKGPEFRELLINEAFNLPRTRCHGGIRELQKNPRFEDKARLAAWHGCFDAHP